jgi:membrane protein
MRLQDAKKLLVEAGHQWVSDRAPRLAAALAYYTILSLAPLLVISTAIAGLIFGEEAARGEIVNQLRGLIGSAGAEVVQTALRNSYQPRADIIAAILGVAILMFGASGVFAELQDALNTVWKVRKKPSTGWLQVLSDRFLSFAMVLAVGFLLLVSLVLSAILSAVGMWLGILFPDIGLLLEIFNVAFSLVVITLLFALIFRYLPDVIIPWRDILGGAFITALLFTIGKSLIGYYIGQTGIATPFGAAGSVVVFVVWIYYSGLIFFYGAELTQVIADNRRSASQSSPIKYRPIQGVDISGLPTTDMPR